MKSFQLILLCFVCVAKSYGQGGRIVVEITKEKHKYALSEDFNIEYKSECKI
jgi:hypothetical protein